MAMALVVARGVIETLLTQAARAHPLEACGLLSGACGRIDHAVVTANVHPDPLRHFEIDPAALIAAHKAAREGGAAVAGYWHSHPSGAAVPSATDRASAAGGGKVWAIVAGGEVAFWCDGSGGFEPLSYIVPRR